MRRITVEVPSVWLLDDLVGYSFNGGIYSTQSARQNAMFVGDGIDDIGAALGFLARHAKEKSGLDLAGIFSKIDTEQLPFIEIWIPAVKAYFRALEMEAKRKNEPIDTVHLDAILKVIDNTLNMIDVSAKEAEAIYNALTDQYVTSLEHLYESLVTKLEQRLKKSGKMYSFSDAIKHEFIPSKPLVDKYGEALYQKIISHKQASEPKIPMIAFLGGKIPSNKLEYTTLSLSVTEPNARAGDKCNKGQLWVRQYSFGVDGSFLLNLNSGNVSYHVTYGSLSKPVVDFTPSSSCYNKDEVYKDGKERKYVINIRNSLVASHRTRNEFDHAAAASVTGIAVGEYTQTHLNEGIAAELAAHIVKSLRAGGSLTTLFGNVLDADCLRLLLEAANDVILDAKNAKAIDGLKMSKTLTQAYGQLIGLPKEILNQLWAHMVSDAEFLMQFPSVSNDIKSNLNQVNETVTNATEHRSSAIEANLIKMRDESMKVRKKARNQNAYIENLAEWQRDVKAYQNLLGQVDAMSKAGMLPEKDVMLDLDMHYLMLSQGHQILSVVHQQLSEDGYAFEAPQSLDVLAYRADQAEASSEVKSSPDDNLTFSLPKAVELIEGSIEHMFQQPSHTMQACIHLGSTGEGKSEKINYICGIDFELLFDNNGQHFASPLNNVSRVVNAGYGASITKNATMIEIDGCMHVDLAGSSDDDGREADVARAFQIKMLPLIFDSISVIDLTVSASHIYEGRWSAITKTFQEAGLIISKNPALNAKHIVISVTKFSLSPLSKSKGSAEDHQMMIFNKLRSWHDKTIKYLDEEHEHYPINNVLEHLTPDQIIIVDVLDAQYRAPYLERLKVAPTSKAVNFDFQGIDREERSLEKFIEDIGKQYDSNEDDIYEARKTLRRHFIYEAEQKKPYQRSDVSDDMLDMVYFEALQEEQSKLHESVQQVLNNGVDGRRDTSSKMAGSVETLAQRVADLMIGQEQTKPLLERLTKLLEPIDTVPRENQRQKASSSSGCFIPGTCVGASVIGSHPSDFPETKIMTPAWEIMRTQKSSEQVFHYAQHDMTAQSGELSIPGHQACEIDIRMIGKDIEYSSQFDRVVGVESVDVKLGNVCTREDIAWVGNDLKQRLPQYETRMRMTELHDLCIHLSANAAASGASTAVILLVRDIMLSEGYSPSVATWASYFVAQGIGIGRIGYSVYSGLDFLTATLPMAASNAVYFALIKSGFVGERYAGWSSNVVSFFASQYTGAGLLGSAAHLGVSKTVSYLISLGEQSLADRYLTSHLHERCEKLTTLRDDYVVYLNQREINELDDLLTPFLNKIKTNPEMNDYVIAYGLEQKLEGDLQVLAKHTQNPLGNGRMNHKCL